MNIDIEICDVVFDGINFHEIQGLELRQALQCELAGLLDLNTESYDASSDASTRGVHLESNANSSPLTLAFGLAQSIGKSMQKKDITTSITN